MFRLDNEAEFIRGIKKFEAELDKTVEEVYRGWSVMLFGRILRTTPQWTGNAASNWAYNVGSPSYDTSQVIIMEAERAEEQGVPIKPKKMGHPEAISMARSANTGKEKTVKLTGKDNLPTIYISNASKSLTGKSYITYLESNPNNFLRAENEPGHMVARASDFYGNRGKISVSDQRMYRGARI